MDINALLGITESYKMPERLLSVMLDPQEKEGFLDMVVMQSGGDLSADFMRDYFQAEHGDRDRLKQDYTPDCICRLIQKIMPESGTVLDVCAGTGALTVGMYSKGARFECEELSERAIPVLLINLSVRNISGSVRQKNVLTRQTERTYILTAGKKYSDIELLENAEQLEQRYPAIVSNPPYSLKWEPRNDERFENYGIAPAKAADYAFILDIVSRLADGGKAAVILPTGVLFRGNSEAVIRQKLIENNLIESIIGLPPKLFLNTDIPVLIMVISKAKSDSGIFFIDGAKLFDKGGKQNTMSAEHIEKIAAAYTLRQNIGKLAAYANAEKLADNEYNLNIPRYVDTYEPPVIPDIKKVTADLMRLDDEIRQADKELAEMLEQLDETDPDKSEHYRENIKPFVEWLKSR